MVVLAPSQAVTASAVHYAFLAHILSLRSFSVSIQQHTAQSLYLCYFMLTAMLHQRTEELKTLLYTAQIRQLSWHCAMGVKAST